MKDKKIWIVAAVLVVILAIGGVAYLAFSHKSASISQDNSQSQDLAVPTLTPDAIGLTLTSARDGKAVLMQLTKIDGISSIDYEVTYTAQGNIPRGVIGHIDIKPTDTSEQQEVVLGTCSNVCHYDTGVQDIKFVLKVAKTDNKTYQVTQTFSF